MFANHVKGEVGELEVASDLLQNGFEVLEPVSQNCPYDLVAHDLESGVFHSVQVKHAQLQDGVIQTQFRRRVQSVRNRKRETNEAFDVGAIYCPQLDECFYIAYEDFEQSVSLRVESERDMASIRWASEHEEFPI